MKTKLFILSLMIPSIVLGLEPQGDCQAPGQGFLENKIKDVFQVPQGESELKEWVMHPKNANARQELKQLDRRMKFSQQRLEREELLNESQVKFEEVITNTGRPSELEHFPMGNAASRISSSRGALSLEMTKLPTDELDVLPPEVLKKLEPKVKINYYFPYDKFDYQLTYDGKELPMTKALLLVQRDMEDACERRQIDNAEYRNWYNRHHGSGSSTGSSRSSGQ